MIACGLGVLLIVVTLWDGFEATVLPRRVTRRWRPVRLYFRTTWAAWRRTAEWIPAGRNRENTLAIYGPLSLLGLFASWICVLIVGFTLIHWGLDTLAGESDLRHYLYMSGETIFTLGYGDITPKTYPGKFLSVVEAGLGFGFMAIIIGYLPVLYQSFSQREQSIALLDGRAGSPPTAAEFIRRLGVDGSCGELERILAEWESWSAALLESHLSFPVLGFYRSQHDNQSWLATLATILDVSATLVVTGGAKYRRRAELTFAMARHASVDLCLVLWLPPVGDLPERLSADEAQQLLTQRLVSAPTPEQLARLNELRALYEPFIHSLAHYFRFRLPRFTPGRSAPDNWQTSPWMGRAPGLTDLPRSSADEESHFG